RGPRAWSSAVEKLSRYGPRAWWAAASVLLLGLVVAWAAVVFKVKTKDGVIVLENVPDNAVVEVDGDKVTVTRAVGEPVRIEVQPGKHVVIVKRGDDVLLGEHVILGSGKAFKLPVRYERIAASAPPRSGEIATNGPPEATAPPTIDRSRFSKLVGKWLVDGDE